MYKTPAQNSNCTQPKFLQDQLVLKNKNTEMTSTTNFKLLKCSELSNTAWQMINVILIILPHLIHVPGVVHS